MQTPEGKQTPKAVRAEVHSLLEAKSWDPVVRSSLKGAVQILQTWEAIPLKEGSRQWDKAFVRFAADTLVRGLYRNAELKVFLMQPGLGLQEARLWLYKDADGNIQRHYPLAQPWYRKDLEWDFKRNALVTVARGSTFTCVPEMRPELHALRNPERLRLSVLTFHQLLERSALAPPGRIEITREPPSPREPVEVDSVIQPSATSIGSRAMEFRPRIPCPGLSSSSEAIGHDANTQMKGTEDVREPSDDHELSDDPSTMEIQGDTIVILRDMGAMRGIGGGMKRRYEGDHGFCKKVDAKVWR